MKSILTIYIGREKTKAQLFINITINESTKKEISIQNTQNHGGGSTC
jgi:hypothetical protein